ncbi:hypothetical protein POVWA2_010900 [Plasmodium ovale wallikeri]|uniref:Uncharacterized protein n=1 Tax=Plasmodium ovale wallikeri TaxID=864142 RepID=A0A1A8YMB4_PLAOA|nr:hypothetical protein POVWA1_010730 [Plasmodium ovale wallikeri]SBT32678.1 hypothetical protein POVWA2_010900 [Plasmodium ovale wallikeri]
MVRCGHVLPSFFPLSCCHVRKGHLSKDNRISLLLVIPFEAFPFRALPAWPAFDLFYSTSCAHLCVHGEIALWGGIITFGHFPPANKPLATTLCFAASAVPVLEENRSCATFINSLLYR